MTWSSAIVLSCILLAPLLEAQSPGWWMTEPIRWVQTNLRISLWPYASTDNVNRACNTDPHKMAVNQCMSFVDFAWRFSMVPRAEISTRLRQNVANGMMLPLTRG